MSKESSDCLKRHRASSPVVSAVVRINWSSLRSVRIVARVLSENKLKKRESLNMSRHILCVVANFYS